MSIVLLIANDDLPKNEWESIPIATEATFSRIWIPLSKELSLQYVPIFQTGIDIDAECLSDVLKELNRLKSLMKAKISNDKYEYKPALDRLNRLISLLPNSVKQHNAVFIG